LFDLNGRLNRKRCRMEIPNTAALPVISRPG
jgi:hypothetical protein